MNGGLSLPANARICVLRLSALGDVTHMLPVVHALRTSRPDWHLTWIIGRLEHALVGDLPGVEFVVFDKGEGWRAYRRLGYELRGRRFDALLQMQVALRASVAGRMVRARHRIGFDRARSRDGHGLFINRRIAPHARPHVLDGFVDFLAALDIPVPELRWDLPIPDAARAFAREHLAAASPILAINPCTSARLMNWRNWSAERYAAVIDHAWHTHGLRTVLTGGPAAAEQEMARAITRHAEIDVINLVGQTSPKQLAAVLAQARAAIAPDTGPAHIANAVGTPVIGLYATSNPERTGPYRWRDWCVNGYPEALREETGLTPEQARWGRRVRDPEAMARITVADVAQRLDQLIETLGDAGSE